MAKGHGKTVTTIDICIAYFVENGCLLALAFIPIVFDFSLFSRTSTTLQDLVDSVYLQCSASLQPT
jgi:hypothetical protein